MIFSIQPTYRNCPHCNKKVPFYGTERIEAFVNQLSNSPLTHCTHCGQPFPIENTDMIQAVIAECQRRVERPKDPSRVLFLKFYSAFGAYHHIYAIPFYSVEELLTVENLLHHGRYVTRDFWIASFVPAQQFRQGNAMSLLSWCRLLWDQEREIFLIGSDEGPNIVEYTPFE